MKILSFDIEISDIFELGPGEDLDRFAPFHISVAATSIVGGEELHWYSEDADGRPTKNITAERSHELLEYLESKQQEGFKICAWNGLGFDFRWIGYNAKDDALAARVARKSYDPMFQFFNLAGFPVSLAKVAQGMDVPLAKSMSGADAPKEWCAGNHQKVMEYVLGDCRMTNLVVEAIVREGRVRWITARGRRSEKTMRELLPAETVIELPGPDQSWMDTPMLKSKFYAWLDSAQ